MNPLAVKIVALLMAGGALALTVFADKKAKPKKTDNDKAPLPKPKPLTKPKEEKAEEKAEEKEDEKAE